MSENLVSDFLKIVLPAGLVLYAMYLTVRASLNRFFAEKAAPADLTPLRVQAYERLCLLLERMKPQALLLRQAPAASQSSGLQALLLADLREEFNHNAAQQIYISDEAWERIRFASQEMAGLINRAAREVSPEAPALELARKIGELSVQQPQDVVQDSLEFLKQEARQVMGI